MISVAGDKTYYDNDVLTTLLLFYLKLDPATWMTSISNTYYYTVRKAWATSLLQTAQVWLHSNSNGGL